MTDSPGELFDVRRPLLGAWSASVEAIGADHLRLSDGRTIMRCETTGGRSRGVAGVSGICKSSER